MTYPIHTFIHFAFFAMANTILIPNFTPMIWIYLSFLLFYALPVASLNITHILAAYPAFSSFSDLLSAATVAADISARSSLTILAVPNSYLRSESPDLTDVLRYHVLLEYLSLSDLRRFPPSGRSVTTLLQTTGRAAANSGTVNVTFDSSSGSVAFHSPTSDAALLSQIETLPYNLSIMSVDSFLIPNILDLTASEFRLPAGINITRALIDGHDFNVAAAMLSASGVVSEFESDEIGAGITMFVPTDDAFSNLPPSVRFQSLPADEKAVVLRFHVLHSYYPLGSLQSIVNPVQPTLGTEQNGAGSFTLNISRVNGSVGIDTGIVQASVTQTVFDQNPVAIFGISQVLLPREFYGNNPIETESPSGGVSAAEPPDSASLPDKSPSSHVSKVGALGLLRTFLGLLCTGIFYNLLL